MIPQIKQGFYLEQSAGLDWLVKAGSLRLVEKVHTLAPDIPVLMKTTIGRAVMTLIVRAYDSAGACRPVVPLTGHGLEAGGAELQQAREATVLPSEEKGDVR